MYGVSLGMRENLEDLPTQSLASLACCRVPTFPAIFHKLPLISRQNLVAAHKHSADNFMLAGSFPLIQHGGRGDHKHGPNSSYLHKTS